MPSGVIGYTLERHQRRRRAKLPTDTNSMDDDFFFGEQPPHVSAMPEIDEHDGYEENDDEHPHE